MRRGHGLILLVLVTAIVVAHVFLWLSPSMRWQTKLAYTLLNAAGWTVVLAPIWLVSRWLSAVERRNAEARENQP